VLAFAKHRPDNFVYGVMPAYIFPCHQQAALEVEDCSRVQPTRAIEESLGFSQLSSKSVKRLIRNMGIGLNWGRLLPDTLDAGFSADAAAGGSVEVPAPSLRINQGWICRIDVHDVPFRTCIIRRAVGHGCDVCGVPDDPFCEEESGGEVEVVAGCSHGDRHAAAGKPDLQWLLNDENVGSAPGRASFPGFDVGVGDGRPFDSAHGCSAGPPDPEVGNTFEHVRLIGGPEE
jgi:hypothetical protein